MFRIQFFDSTKVNLIISHSPYSSQIITLDVGQPGQEKLQYYVQRDLLKHSALFSATSHMFAIDLNDVDRNIGHILVQFLYTGTYQALNDTDASKPNGNALFRPAVSTYLLAEAYTIPGLQQLAKDSIESLGRNMSIFAIMEAIRDGVSPLPSSKSWFYEYVKTKAKTAFDEDYTIFEKDAFLDSINDIALSKFLATYVRELYYNKLSELLETLAASVPDTDIGEAYIEESTTVDESSVTGETVMITGTDDESDFFD
jgi:hypothetical protein